MYVFRANKLGYHGKFQILNRCLHCNNRFLHCNNRFLHCNNNFSSSNPTCPSDGTPLRKEDVSDIV